MYEILYQSAGCPVQEVRPGTTYPTREDAEEALEELQRQEGAKVERGEFDGPAAEMWISEVSS
jgi:hypothetical protein